MQMRAITMGFAAMLAAGCGGFASPYRSMAMAYQSDTDAQNGLFGYTVHGPDPIRIGPGRSFVPSEVRVFDAEGDLELQQSLKHTLTVEVEAALAASAAKQCEAKLGVQNLGAARVTRTRAEFKKGMTADSSHWLQARSRCCMDTGARKDSVCGADVIVGIYYSELEFDMDAHYGGTVDGTIDCAPLDGAKNAKVALSVGSDKKVTIKSSGWNVVQLADAKDVCEHVRAPTCVASLGETRLVPVEGSIF